MVRLLRKTVWQSLTELKIESPCNPAVPLLGIYTKELKIRTQRFKYLYTHTHSSIIHNSQKLETTQVPINELMNRLIVVHTHNEILLHLEKEGNSMRAVTWMNLEDFMRCGISQAQKEDAA